MAAQTSRKDTSFVKVYPCSTLGSALLSGVCDFQGSGKVPALLPVKGAISCTECFERRGDKERILSRNLCFFSSFGLLPVSKVLDLGSPSQTSISIQRHPRRRTLIDVSALALKGTSLSSSPVCSGLYLFN